MATSPRFSWFRLRFWYGLWAIICWLTKARTALTRYLYIATFTLLLATPLTWGAIQALEAAGVPSKKEAATQENNAPKGAGMQSEPKDERAAQKGDAPKTAGVQSKSKEEEAAQEDGIVAVVHDGLEQALQWEILATALVLLGVLLHRSFQRGRSLLVCPFKSYLPEKGNGEKKTRNDLGEGIARYFQSELTALMSLYQTIDEFSPSSRDKVVAVGPIAMAGDSAFDEAVSPTTQLEVGPLKVPIGMVVATIGRLIPGPRLVGSLHEEGGGKLALIASLRGGGNKSWRVESSDLDTSSSETSQTLYSMAENLALRMVPHVLALGSPRWQAVRHYTAGLRQLRLTLRTEKNKSLNLWRAERSFRQALQEDQGFAECHFNLGFVYREMGLLGAAATAFRKALENDPNNSRACYALADIAFAQEKYEDAIWLARTTLDLEAQHLAARNLLGVALWNLRQREGRSSTEFLGDVWPQFETAAADAWRALCRAVWKGGALGEPKDVARLITGNLALAYSQQEHHSRSRAAYRMALRLRPNDPGLNLALGMARAHAEDWRGAHAAFDRVLEEGFATALQAELWIHLLGAHCHLAKSEATGYSHREGAVDCFRLAIDTVALLREFLPAAGELPPKEALATLKKLLRELPAAPAVEGVPSLGDLEEVLDFLDQLWSQETPLLEHLVARLGDSEKKLRPTRDPGIQQHLQHLEALEQRLVWQGGDWIRTQLRIELALRHADIFLASPESKPRFESAKRHLEEAIAGSEYRRLAERFKRPLTYALARILLSYSTATAEADGPPDPALLKQALSAAQAAVALAPEGVNELFLLGQAYLVLEDYDLAEAQLRTCLYLRPAEPGLITYLGHLFQMRGRSRIKPSARRAELEKGVSLLKEALDLLESVHSVNGLAHADAHFELGVLYYCVGRHDESVGHLKIALAGGYEPSKVRTLLGKIYEETSESDKAEEAYQQVLACKPTTPSSRRQSAEFDVVRIVALLACALLRGEGDPETKLWLDEADTLIERMAGLRQRRSRAQYLECLGRLRYRSGDLEASIDLLERAQALAPTASIALWLARAQVTRIEGEPRRKPDLTKVREACRLATDLDFRGVLQGDIAEIRRRAEQVEQDTRRLEKPELVLVP